MFYVNETEMFDVQAWISHVAINVAQISDKPVRHNTQNTMELRHHMSHNTMQKYASQQYWVVKLCAVYAEIGKS